jgi:hypothetical protein
MKVYPELQRIIDDLKRNGYRDCHDEPWMHFSAELVEGGPYDLSLIIGYDFNQNGDVCFDPLFTINIKGGEIVEILYHSWASGPMKVSPGDSFVRAFLELVWERHWIGGSSSEHDVSPTARGEFLTQSEHDAPPTAKPMR